MVHCLPYCSSWLWDNITPDSDLGPTTRQFGRLAQQVLAEADAPAAGVGPHSFRREGAAELSHGGLSLLHSPLPFGMCRNAPQGRMWFSPFTPRRTPAPLGHACCRP